MRRLALVVARPRLRANRCRGRPHHRAARLLAGRTNALRIQAALPKAELAGVQLATEQGKPARLDRRAAAAPLPDAALGRPPRTERASPDGSYLIRLVEASARRSPPPRSGSTRRRRRITEIRAHNRSREPFQGDNDRLTTISSNGDGLRESAKISFTLSERARVHFEVTRTVSAPVTIYELTANLPAGPAHVHLAPALVGRRAHVSRPDHGHRRRRQPPHLRRRQRPRRAGGSRPRSCACSASTPASPRRATSPPSSARLADRDRRDRR